MQATSFSTFAATSARRTGLIVAAMLAAIALGAVLLDPGPDSRAAVPAAVLPTSAGMVPVGIVGESAVPGDPSVPSATSVFRNRGAVPEEPPVTF
jgi:hypothetical protein